MNKITKLQKFITQMLAKNIPSWGTTGVITELKFKEVKRESERGEREK